MIFGQCDPGKTPYNSWGKPVQELFFISENAFFTVRNIQQNNQQENLQLISFPVPHSKLGITANMVSINVVRPPRFSCPLSTLNAVVRPALNAMYRLK